MTMPAQLSWKTVVEAGRGAHGELGVTEVDLERWGTQRGADPQTCGPDAYLACALCAGATAATQVFELSVVPAIRQAIAAVAGTASTLDELVQRARSHLLVADGGPARITQYKGAGSLAGFAATVGVRLALTDRRGAGPDASDGPSLGELADPVSLERALTRGESKSIFEAAVAAALQQLSAKDRTLLRLHFVEAIPAERLAPLYSAGRSTVSRWIVSAREELARRTREQLGARGVGGTDTDSMLASMQSGMGVSLFRLLEEADPRTDGPSPSAGPDRSTDES